MVQQRDIERKLNNMLNKLRTWLTTRLLFGFEQGGLVPDGYAPPKLLLPGERLKPIVPINNMYLQRTIDNEQQAVIYTVAVPFNVRYTKEPDDADMEIVGKEPVTISDILLQLSVIAALSEQEPVTLH